MPGPRLVVDRLPAAGATCRVAGEELAHARARRLAVGDTVVLIDGTGREAAGRVLSRGREALEVAVESVRDGRVDALPPIVLCIAAVKAERLSWIAEKATELGAAGLTLVESQRTQAFRASPALIPRLERVAREAAKQSERALWPAITGPVSLAELIRADSSGNRLILDPQGEQFPPTLRREPTSLLVGPEGGWSPTDAEAAISAGWLAVSLAAGILRAETAAVAALVLARSALCRASEPRGG